MESLPKLRAKRTNIKGQITQFIRFIREHGEQQKEQLPDRIRRAEELYNTYNEIQSQIAEIKIEALMARTHAAEDMQILEAELARERESVEDNYFVYVAIAKQLIETSPSNNVSQAPDRQVSNLNIKLPTLQLPKFNGNYDQWLMFKDTFTSVIDSNPRLANIQKFQYLRSSLTGEALQVIHTLETTDENYETAWRLVKERYENKKLIINTHMKELFELTAVSRNNHTALRNFIDSVRTHMRALEALKQPVQQWDTILLYLLSDKLDYATRKDWELEVGRRFTEGMPTLEALLEFLTNRAHTLELVEGSKNRQESIKSTAFKKADKKINVAAIAQIRCTYCEGSHHIARCTKFQGLSAADKREEIKKQQLCFNCLRKGHYVQECTASTCKICSKKHNTILHVNKAEQNESNKLSTAAIAAEAKQTKDDAEKIDKESKVIVHSIRSMENIVFIATARIYVTDNGGNTRVCRALLDPGSQSNIITRDLANKLRLKTKRIDVSVSGISGTKTAAKESATIKISSMHNKFTTSLECLIMPSITEKIPTVKVHTHSWKIPEELALADANFNVPGNIDILIGSSTFWKLLCAGQRELNEALPRLQETQLGWIVGGEVINSRDISSKQVCNITTINLNEQLEKFWNIEELPKKQQHIYSPQEQAAEEHFLRTVKRNKNGRYVVSLPKNDSIILGESESRALKRVLSMERRLNQQPELKQKYCEFLREYEELGHMSLIKQQDPSTEQERFYLPHHPVIKSASLSTKLRVVFDGSAKSSTGISLNQKLLVGPNLQQDQWSITIRFRSHQFVMTADIKMMFRQILITEADRNLQRILWRPNTSQAMKQYTLNTITYGTSPAAYLAIRCLRHLATQPEAINRQAAVKALLQDFFMDDVQTGTHTMEEAISLRKELSELLEAAGFPLRKWRTNDSGILQDLSQEAHKDTLLVLDTTSPMKTLGLLWESTGDILQYEVNLTESNETTKRSVLSQIARIYDPLGLIGPVLITAKITMQQLWKLNIDWDEAVPQEFCEAWTKYYRSLQSLTQIKIPRNFNQGNSKQTFIIHGFGDASEKAYGACIYCVYETKQGEWRSELVCSKTRVAPVKAVSLPKLELCAALLLARLTAAVMEAIEHRIQNVHLWSDSTITLCWINTPPHKLKTYYANRVAEIKKIVSDATWQHVPSAQNPADALTRGVTVAEIVTDKLWWHGPQWLPYQEQWPKACVPAVTINTSFQTESVLVMTRTRQEILQRYSSFDKLKRVIAYCLRMKGKSSKQHMSIHLKPEELQRAEISICRMVQAESFPQELRDLQQRRQVHPKSKILALNPFLDEEGIIRVGGRLKHANVSSSQKHPIVLPAKHNITEIILRQEHIKLKHCGAQHLLAAVRMKYWPISGRREARKVLAKCIPCYRYRPKFAEIRMADLPEARVTTGNRPFEICGIDYAGPFKIRESKRRGNIPISKAYVAVFTCFKSKAVHLELVSSLSTEAFMAAFRRFCARRGTCTHIYSDNGTNLVGAANELKEIYKFLQKEKQHIATNLAVQNINWHFIPPRAPHLGGLWEAAVKSVKRHLYITMKELLYTFEEYYTLLVEIEGILNSRPLTAISSDPNDLLPLTPAHFIMGDSLQRPAEHSYLEVKDNHLSRWQHIQKLRQHFWKRWQREYLQQLQTRTRWKDGESAIQTGDLVLIAEDNLPPLQWKLGRIQMLHTGEDGIARVATIKTASGCSKRAVKKLCALPYKD